MNVNTETVYVGVDVAKATLQVHLGGVQIELANTPAGHTKLQQKLQKITNPQVICEATGGYEQALVLSLNNTHTPVSVVNPAQVRASAQAKGQQRDRCNLEAGFHVAGGWQCAGPTSSHCGSEELVMVCAQPIDGGRLVGGDQRAHSSAGS